VKEDGITSKKEKKRKRKLAAAAAAEDAPVVADGVSLCS
jgi:hypothetical protein